MAVKGIKGINVEIGGNTTGLQKALGEVNSKSKDLQSELKQVDKLLKFDPKNTELLAQKQKLLADAVETSGQKLKTLKDTQSQVEAQFKSGAIGEEQYRAFQREIIKAEEDLKSLKDEAKNFGTVFSNQLKQAGEDLKDVGGKITDVGKGMSVGVTAPILGIAAASQVAFNEVDAALDTIVTKTGATGDAMEGLQESFNNVYSSIPADAQTVGDAIGEVNTQFGLMGEELEDVSGYAVKFAEINGQDVTTAITDSKAAMEAFGMSAKDIPSIMDAVTKTAQNTGVATDQLFGAVIKGAPQLKSLGLDFAQSAELIGRFEQKGIDSSKALSYLSKAQVTWAKDGKTMSEGLDELVTKIQSSNSETEKLTLASEAFGTKGASVMLDAIERGALSFDDFAGAAENAAGSVGTTFEGTLDPVDQATIAMNNLKIAGSDLSTTIQGTMAPILEGLVETIQSLTQWFTNLPEGMKQTIVIIGGLLAAIGPVLIIVGQMMTGLGSLIAIGSKLAPIISGVSGAMKALNLVMLANPIGIVIAAIAALIGIFAYLWSTNEDFRNFWIEAWTNISEFFTETLNGIISAGTEIMTNLSNMFSSGLQAVKDLFSSLKDGVINIFTSLTSGVRSKISGIVTTIKDGLQSALDWISDLPDQLFNMGANIIEGLIDGVLSMIKKLKDAIKNVAKTVTDGVSKALDINSPSREMFKLGAYATEGLAGGLQSEVGRISSIMDNISGIVSTLNTESAAGTYNTYNTYNSATPASSLTFGSLITINGNIDPSNVKEVKQGVKDGVKQLQDMIINSGGNTRLKRGLAF
jgi:TP901 family phage tail tape measure protein